VAVDGNHVDTYGAIFAALDNAIPSIGQNLECDLEEYVACYTIEPIGTAFWDYRRYACRTQWKEICNGNESSSTEGGTVGQQLSNTQWRFGDVNTRWRVEPTNLQGLPCKSIYCQTFGTLYVPNQYLGLQENDPEAAYGTWEMWIDKRGNNIPKIGFISDRADFTTYNGYELRIDAAEVITLRRITAGATAATILTSAAGAIVPDTWQRLKVTRRYDATWNIYVEGVLVAGPAMDGVYDTGSFVILDWDAGDEFVLFDKRFGEIT
jgi:hypothetical protein